MANPQTENGYAKIANELIDRFGMVSLSGSEWSILWIIIRKTYGFNKKEAEISLKKFEDLTCLGRREIVRGLKSLIRKKIVLVNLNSYVNKYRFVKNYEEWESEVNRQFKRTKSRGNLDTGNLDTSTLDTESRGNLDTESRGNLDTHKRQKDTIKDSSTKKEILSDKYIDKDSIKDIKYINKSKINNNKLINGRFDEFWSLYPNQSRGSKEAAKKQFISKELYNGNFNVIMNSLNKQIKHKEKMEKNNKFCPNFKHAERWIKYKCWENDIFEEKTLTEKNIQAAKNYINSDQETEGVF